MVSCHITSDQFRSNLIMSHYYCLHYIVERSTHQPTVTIQFMSRIGLNQLLN